MSTLAVCAPIRRSMARDAAVGVASATLLVGFNTARIGAGLDGSSLIPILGAFAALGVAGVAVARAAGLRLSEYGVTRPRMVPSLVGAAVCASAFLAIVIAAGATGRPSPSTLAAAGLLYIGAVAPAEELIIRGLLYGAVERHAGTPAAILVTAIVFAAAHLPVYGVAALPTMIAAGLLLGWLRAWSGSLAAPVAAHALADLLAVAV